MGEGKEQGEVRVGMRLIVTIRMMMRIRMRICETGGKGGMRVREARGESRVGARMGVSERVSVMVSVSFR